MPYRDMPEITAYSTTSTSFQPEIECDLNQNQIIRQPHPFFLGKSDNQIKQQLGDIFMANNKRRIVQVFICDPNENVPLEKSLIHKGDQQLTDATDQELYFEIDLKNILTTHNLERTTWIDKEASKKSGKDIFLEPIKIRDLKMIVTTLAEF